MSNCSCVRSPFYGELNVKGMHPEVKKLWYSRNEELPLLPDVELDYDVMDHEEHIDSKMLKEVLWNIIDNMTPRERTIIAMRFRYDFTLEEVGKSFDVGRERIRQIESKALRKLKHPRNTDVLRENLPISLTRGDLWFESYNRQRRENDVLRDVKFDIPENYFSVYRTYSKPTRVENVLNRSLTLFKKVFGQDFEYGILTLIVDGEEDERPPAFIFVMNTKKLNSVLVDKLVNEVFEKNEISFIRNKYLEMK